MHLPDIITHIKVLGLTINKYMAYLTPIVITPSLLPFVYLKH